MREALRSLLLANNGEPHDPQARAVLDEAARRARLEPTFPPDGAALVPRADGVDAAIGRILAAAFAAMLDGSWARLKACRGELLRLGVLRPLDQRERHLVLDERVRRARQGGRLLPPPPRRRPT